MNLEAVVFGVAFVVALGCSIAMLFAPNAVHVALFLVGAQIALALTFLLQGAFFVAAVQIIVYAGAIMVLFLFVLMLLGVDRRELLTEPLPGQRPFALGLGALLGVLVLHVALNSVGSIATGGEAALAELNRDPGNVVALARSLFGRFLFPFELTSVLLVIAIAGVMALARSFGPAGVAASVSEEAGEEAAA